jgi:predicted O-linked N-acetylglucosamine transferase (SPINDLY family)
MGGPVLFSIVTTWAVGRERLEAVVPGWLRLRGLREIYIVTEEDGPNLTNISKCHRIVIGGPTHPGKALNAGAGVAWQRDQPPFFLFAPSAFESTHQNTFADALAGQPEADFLVEPTGRPGAPHLVRSGLFFYLHGYDPRIADPFTADLNLFARYRAAEARSGKWNGTQVRLPNPASPVGEPAKDLDVYGRSWREQFGQERSQVIAPARKGRYKRDASRRPSGDANIARDTPENAVTGYRRLVFRSPENFIHLGSLGAALVATKRYDEGENALFLGLRTRPDDADLWLIAGDARQGVKRFEEAVAAYTRAIELRSDFIDAWYKRGCAESSRSNYPAAIDCFRRAVAADAEHWAAFHNLGRALHELGDSDAALTAMETAERLHPNDSTRTAIATMIPGAPRADNAAVLAARRACAAHLPRLDVNRPLAGPTDRPLRIGYVSHFFHQPNWMKPVWALVNHHDRERFQIFLFGDCPNFGEGNGYRPHDTDCLGDVRGLDNAGLARLIVEQGIDVLVDLNGYSYTPRLPLFATPLAPVVLGWFNYYATTALPGIDYLIGDDQVITADEEPNYAEPVVRVPGSYLTFEVGYPVPDVSPPPSLTTRRLTFGSLASQYKITPQVIAAWAQILARAPESRLLLRNGSLGEPSVRTWLSAQFAAHGIGEDRLILLGRADHYEFLQTYAQIDVALDTFPYNGGTTTTEAIWQGVPVLSFRGDRWASRTSASLLASADLDEFLLKDVVGYVDKAVTLATSPNTPEMLKALRSTMRERLRAAPACAAAAFARSMEAIYRRLWDAQRERQDPRA